MEHPNSVDDLTVERDTWEAASLSQLGYVQTRTRKSSAKKSAEKSPRRVEAELDRALRHFPRVDPMVDGYRHQLRDTSSANDLSCSLSPHSLLQT